MSKEISPAEKLAAIVRFACDRGWQPTGFDGERRTDLNPKPALLEFTWEYLVESGLFYGLFAYDDFKTALWGLGKELWEKQLRTLPVEEVIDAVYKALPLETTDSARRLASMG